MIEPAANVVAAGAARCSHLRVATSSAKVTRPAGRAGLLRVDMASIEKGAPRRCVHAVVERAHAEARRINRSVTAVELPFGVE